MIKKLKTGDKVKIFGTIFLMILIIIVGLITLPLSEEQKKFNKCSISSWETENCINLWEENYSNGKWADRCSTMVFWTDKVSCHSLCNVDCEFQNKKEGRFMCIC